MTYTTNNASSAHSIVSLVLVGAYLIIGAAIITPFLPALVAVMR